jgi:hypothetical protein
VAFIRFRSDRGPICIETSKISAVEHVVATEETVGRVIVYFGGGQSFVFLESDAAVLLKWAAGQVDESISQS